MRDEQDILFLLLMQRAERVHQTGEAPQIDAGFRFIEDAHLQFARKQRSDLDAIHFSTGQ